MFVPFFIALLAAAATAQCQSTSVTTEIVTRCTTSYSEFPAPTGANIETAYFFTFTTNNLTITSTTQDTTTVTPSATTFTDVVNVTSTVLSTTTIVPAATTVAAPAGFFPLRNAGSSATPTATATAIALGRHRRALVNSRAEHLQMAKRLPETPLGNTGGFIVLPNGQGQSLNRVYPASVECRVMVNVNNTEINIVTGPPATEILVPATATAVSTSTISVTQVVTEVQATPTEYAACQSNNVVSSIRGFNNQVIYFDRVVFQPAEGFPIANSLVVNTTSAVNCCIACQKQPFCAGSFFAPSIQSCHLQLTEAAPTTGGLNGTLPPFPFPSSNSSLPYPTATGAPFPAGNDTIILPTATGLLPSPINVTFPTDAVLARRQMSILPISQPSAPMTTAGLGSGTCSAGSMSLFLGKIYGQSNFPADLAISFSNGPCGRLAIQFDEAQPVPAAELVSRRWVGIDM